MKIKFKNPPVNEVVIGAYFDPPLAALRNEHIGILWSRLKEEFPIVEQRPPINSPIQSDHDRIVLELSDEFVPMPRYWFVSGDEVTLVQIQKDAFLLNWRRGDSEYPSFDENLKPSFDKFYRIFEKFLKEDVSIDPPRIGHCELTYIDVIEVSEYWKGPLDTPAVIPSFVIPDCVSAKNTTPAFNCGYRYDVKPNLQLHLGIRSAVSVKSPDSPLLHLEFKGLGSPNGNEKTDLDAWYDQAHEVILEQFLNMTDETIQREFWIPEDIG